MSASSRSNAAIAELHQSLRFMLKKWRDSIQNSDEKLKLTADPFKGCLARVDTKLSEMMLWDEILLEMTIRPGLCSGSPALVTLLKALRSQITDLTSAVALLSSEARKRAAYDWTLDELAAKKASIQRQTSDALDKLQSQVHREAQKAERWRSYIANLQESMTTTMENVNFCPQSPSNLQLIESDGSFRETKQPLLPVTELDGSNDHLPASLATISMKTSQGEDILVTQIANGDRIITSLTSGSAYYRFDVSDSIGLSIAITQSPAGDMSNFVQLLIGHDFIPTSLSHAYHIRTRQAKHGFLQLGPEHAKSGAWFIKLTGIGIKVKKICLELRMSMALHKESVKQGNLLSEIVNEIDAQQMLTDRLNALEHISVNTTQAIINGINFRNSCASIAVQTSPQFKPEQPLLPSHKPINVKSQLGYFASIFTLPVAEAKSLRRSSLRTTLRMILNLYTERLASSIPNETLCQFIYRFYLKRCNLVKLAETELAELLNVIKTRRWIHIPRIQMFGRLCGIITVADQPPLDNQDATFVMTVISTIKQAVEASTSAGHSRRLDDIDGTIVLQRSVAQQAIDMFFTNDSDTFQSQILKLATSRTHEVGKGKLRPEDSVDGDALIEIIHRRWKEENCISDHHLKQVFKEHDFDLTGWLDFARFVAVWNLIMAVESGPSLILRQPQYASIDLVYIYKQMMENSSHSEFVASAGVSPPNGSVRPFEVNLDAFISVCHSFGLISKRYAETRIPSQLEQRPAADHVRTSSTIPVFERQLSMATSTAAGAGNSNAVNGWTKIINNWKELEQLVLHEIDHIRECKFPGSDDIWNALNRFKTELRLRRDLTAATMSYRNLFDVMVRIVNESPIVPYRAINRTEDSD